MNLVLECVNERVVQPDDVFRTLFEFGSVVIVGRPRIMWLEMAVDNGMRMSAIRLVCVGGRKRRCKCQERHHDKPRHHARNRSSHVRIIAATCHLVQTRGSAASSHESQ